MKKLLLFAFIWLLVGFSTGSSTLIGPVGWLTHYGRARGWSEGVENGLVLGIIVLYVTGSALVSLWLTRVVLRSKHGHVRVGVPALALAAAGAALWLWMTPEVMGGGAAAERTRPGSSFTFGPYPTEKRMKELKREGYTAVVSLLHPAVVPFEPKLLGEEREAAERVGIELIHVPMLPWVSDNTEALARIETLARSGEGRYYVHCYLGQDRVRLLQRVVEAAEANVTYELEARASDGLKGKKSFERGEIIELVDGVFLTPYPTDDEFMKYILPVYPRVVSLLEPGRDGDTSRIDEERTILESHGIDFTLLPIETDDYDADRVREIAETVARMPRPLVVHAFLPASSGRSASAESFLQAFRSNLPPLPPTFFKRAMENGPARVIAPNVAVGPRPTPREFGAYLPRRGVREVVYLGEAGSAAAREGRAACQEANLGFRTAAASAADLIGLVKTAGPWYLYGPGLGGVEGRIAGQLGPAVPVSMAWTPVPDVEKEARALSHPDAPAQTELLNDKRLAPSGAEGVAPSEADPAPSGAAEEKQADAGGLLGFVDAIVPDAKKIILLGPPLLLFTIAAAGLAGWLRARRKVRAPYTRKVFHFLIFTAAGLLHLLGGLSTVALFGGIVTCAVLYAVARGDGFPFYEAMARPTDAPRRTMFILVPLATTALGGLGANLFFGAFAFVGYLVAGWGDAIGEPVGTAFGRHRYRVPSIAGVAATRSLEGSAAVCAVGILAAFLGLSASGLPLHTALTAAALCGTVGCAVEAVSNHGLDNLTIQLAASGVAFLVLT